ncbi:MAG: tetratricopeptide repeat protein, partial [Bacteroidota bacterium]
MKWKVDLVFLVDRVFAYCWLGLLLLCTATSRPLVAQVDSVFEAAFDLAYEAAFAYDEAGAYPEAVAAMEEAYQLAVAQEHWPYAILYALGEKANLLNQYDQLRAYYETIQLGQELTEKHFTALGEDGDYTRYFFSSSLGYYYFRRGSYHRAEDIYRELYTNFQRNAPDSIHQLSEITRELGLIEHRKGNYELSLEYYQQSLGLAEQDESGYFEVSDLAFLKKRMADVYKDLQQPRPAEALYREALQILANTPLTYRRLRNRILAVYRDYADFELQRGDAAKALDLLVKSIPVHTDDDPAYVETYRRLGEVHAAQAD